MKLHCISYGDIFTKLSAEQFNTLRLGSWIDGGKREKNELYWTSLAFSIDFGQYALILHLKPCLPLMSVRICSLTLIYRFILTCYAGAKRREENK